MMIFGQTLNSLIVGTIEIDYYEKSPESSKAFATDHIVQRHLIHIDSHGLKAGSYIHCYSTDQTANLCEKYCNY